MSKIMPYIKRNSDNSISEIKFYNITLYKKDTIVAKYESYTKIKFLNGLIYIGINNVNLALRIKVLGILIFFLGDFYNKRVGNINFSLPVFINTKKNNENIKFRYLYNYAKNKIPNFTYDSIFYLAQVPTGELYIILNLLKKIKEKNNLKNTLLIVNKKYAYNLCKLYCPYCDCLIDYDLKLSFKTQYFSFVKKCKIFVFFPKEYYLEVENDIRNQLSATPHYFLSMLKQLELTPKDIEFNPIIITESIQNSMLEKIKDLNLNLENFIFIAPEAKSCKWVSANYWSDIIKSYQAKGYDVFVNLLTNNLSLQDVDYKTCFLTYPEAFALAQKAKRIIALRSGFAEFLSQTNVPLEIIYTDFERYEGTIKSNYIQKGFSLKQLPHINTDIITEVIKNEYL